MARPLSTHPGRRALLATTALVLLLHALALALLGRLLRPPSLLRDVAPPFYTRTITPEAPAAAVVAQRAPAPAVSKTKRPVARIQRAPAAPETEANQATAPSTAASGAEAADAALTAGAPEAPASAALAQQDLPDSATPPAPDSVAATPPATAASAAEPAFLAQWPGDTRLRYTLGGNYRGELHGDARVLWQREGTRYHTAVQLDVGLLLSMSLTSQGQITAAGLQPAVFEEQVRQRRRGVRLDEDVRLNNGERLPRPAGVQDAASQFVELGHRLATGQISAQPGSAITLWLARPGGVDEWTYDVVGEDTLHLPRLGAVRALHFKPRPLAKPRGPIQAEFWFAPTLQYLPVRIRITQGADSHMDLLVETIEQR